MRYAEIAVDAPTGWGRTFSYAVPPALAVSPGHLVQVPFGPRYVHGIVFEMSASPQVEQTRDLMGLVEPVPLLSPTQLELARWISEYYRAPLFSAAAPMLPPGFRSQARPVVSLKEEPPDETVTPHQRRVLAFLRRAGGAAEEARLARVLGQGALRVTASLARRGLVERMWRWARPRVRPRYVAHLRLVSETQASPDLLKRRAPRQAQLLEALAAGSDQGLLLSRARRDFGASGVAGLLAKGLAQVVQVQHQRDPLAGQRVAYSPPPLPTEAQAAALRTIHRALDDAQAHPRAFLLYGVTGSGKTEVYLQAMAHCVDRGKKGLVLVPEIALTPQTVQRFSARFPGRVAVLHSGLSAGEQFDQWWRVYEGAYDVVVGSRGAIFAPQPSQGLIVLDEEHEWTYKQHDAPPRYHARDVALRLGELTGAVVLLGTATPEVGTYYGAQQGRYRLLELPQRLAGPGSNGGLAPVQIVDMRRELRDGNRSIFSQTLQEALKECLGAAGQAILFLNRRGAATVVQCRDCGHVLRCGSCAVPFTFHGPPSGYLLCHLCNRRRRSPQACPVCEGAHIRYLGLGTQRVIEEVGRLLPGARVLRWDRDVATTHRGPRGAPEALQFRSGRCPGGHADGGQGPARPSGYPGGCYPGGHRPQRPRLSGRGAELSGAVPGGGPRGPWASGRAGRHSDLCAGALCGGRRRSAGLWGLFPSGVGVPARAGQSPFWTPYPRGVRLDQQGYVPAGGRAAVGGAAPSGCRVGYDGYRHHRACAGLS